MIAYPIELTPDDNGTFLVTCPDLVEVTTFGVGEAACFVNGQKAVAEAVASRLAGFEAIPRPSVGQLQAELDLQLTLKVLLFWSLEDAGLTRADLVRLLGQHRPQIDRLFDPRHATRLNQYDAAFRALGRVADVVVRVAA